MLVRVRTYPMFALVLVIYVPPVLKTREKSIMSFEAILMYLGSVLFGDLFLSICGSYLNRIHSSNPQKKLRRKTSSIPNVDSGSNSVHSELHNLPEKQGTVSGKSIKENTMVVYGKHTAPACGLDNLAFFVEQSGTTVEQGKELFQIAAPIRETGISKGTQNNLKDKSFIYGKGLKMQSHKTVMQSGIEKQSEQSNMGSYITSRISNKHNTSKLKQNKQLVVEHGLQSQFDETHVSFKTTETTIAYGWLKKLLLRISTMYVFIAYVVLSSLVRALQKKHKNAVYGIIIQEAEHLNRGNTPDEASDSSHNSDDVKRETYRLKTFENYPLRIKFLEFSKAGFYFQGVDSKLKCFACNHVLEQPSAMLDPFLLSNHERTCAFTRRQSDCGNIPISGPSQPRQGISPGNIEQQNSEGTGARPSQPISTLTNPVYQTARVVSSINTPLVPPPGNAVPIMRHLAEIESPEHAQLISQLDLCKEVDRIQSFTSAWARNSLPTPHNMAKHGWFYLGNLDRTQCFSCGGVLRNWRRSDDPGAEHLRHFSRCAMAQGVEPRNVPDENPDNRQHVTYTQLTEQQRLDLRDMFPCDAPAHPNMRSMSSRSVTFVNWIFTRATPAMLAEAGFFALGVKDRVKCFYCNGGLQNWRRNDDPFEQHAKWYPHCEYLLQVRGPEYIHAVVAQYPDLERPGMGEGGRNFAPATNLSNREPSRNIPVETLHPPASQTQATTSRAQPSVDDLMNTELAAAVLAMGFPVDTVRRAALNHVAEHNREFDTAASWVEAVLLADESSPPDPGGDVTENQPPRTEVAPPPSGEDASLEAGEFEDLYTSNGSGSELRMEMEASSTHTSIQATGGNEAEISHAEAQANVPSAREVADQLKQLQDDRTCKVCLNSLADMVFIPCGHLCCCIECTRALRVCPICRVRIERAVRTYTGK